MEGTCEKETLPSHTNQVLSPYPIKFKERGPDGPRNDQTGSTKQLLPFALGLSICICSCFFFPRQGLLENHKIDISHPEPPRHLCFDAPSASTASTGLVTQNRHSTSLARPETSPIPRIRGSWGLCSWNFYTYF